MSASTTRLASPNTPARGRRWWLVGTILLVFGIAPLYLHFGPLYSSKELGFDLLAPRYLLALASVGVGLTCLLIGGVQRLLAGKRP